MYFLAKDVSNVWHAGSPANHTEDRVNSPLFTIFSSHNLATIIAKIQGIDGGNWPDARSIEAKLERYYEPPKLCLDSTFRLEGAAYRSIMRMDDGIVVDRNFWRWFSKPITLVK